MFQIVCAQKAKRNEQTAITHTPNARKGRNQLVEFKLVNVFITHWTHSNCKHYVILHVRIC